MGGGGSKQQSQTVISNETINETTKNIVNKSVNKQELQTVTQQNMSIEGIDFVSCRPSIVQNMDLTIKVMQTFSGQDSTNLVNDIMNSLDSQVQEQASSESGFGDIMSGGSENDSYTEIRNNIHNKLTSNITNEFINEQSSKVATKQGLVLKNITMDPLGFNVLLKIATAMIERGYPEYAPKLTEEMMMLAANVNCPINQDLAINYTAQQVAEKVSEIINTDTAANDLKNKLEKESTSKTQGAGEAVADAAEGIGAGVGGAAQGVGAGVGTAAQGVGAGVGDAATGIGAGAAAAMAGPFIPFAVSSSSMMAAGMVMMMMSKGGGPDPAMMAALMKR